MPKTSKSGRPKQDELPGTLQRSDKKAQRTYTKTYDSAMESYGEEERAQRTAYAALKHSYERVGDHWERKPQQGPSDPQAEGGYDTDRDTAGGVDANAAKAHLYEIAQRLEVPGRSTMDKDELVEAIQKANERATREARKNH